MIKFEKYDNSQEMYACNSCHNFKEHTMYQLLIGYSRDDKMFNGGQLTYLCSKCAKELKQSIVFRKSVKGQE